MIYDDVELQKFLNILPDLENDEVYFISLAARKKYLTIEEQKEINLNHAEMFNRMVIRSKERIPRIITRLSGNGYYSKNDMLYPDKCLVAYFNVNPTSMLAAYQEFSNNMTKYVIELAKNKNPIENHSMTKLRKLDVELMNSIQRKRSRKTFIDIDVDTKDISILNGMRNVFNINGVVYHVISTHGGYHILLVRSTISFNYTKVVRDYNALTDSEVIVNSNEMIPMPGTMQGGHLVKLIP